MSVLILYSLANTITTSPKAASVPVLASVLHILSPAGLFMSAPVAESLFALLHTSAMLAYCRSRPNLASKHERSVTFDIFLLLSGVLFAIACTMRSNGLFSGVVYAYDLIALTPQLFSEHNKIKALRHAATTVSAGVIMLSGFLYPQFIAYKQYCQDPATNSPAWCYALPPSITTHVQSHYW